jgi:transcriptional regulator with XRE-family HTH domain
MTSDQLTSALEAAIGEQLRLLRLRQNTDQRQLAARAGVALNAVKRLEAGKGVTLRSLVKVLRALGRADWLNTLSPAVSSSPLQLAKARTARRRAYARRAPRAV